MLFYFEYNNLPRFHLEVSRSIIWLYPNKHELITITFAVYYIRFSAGKAVKRTQKIGSNTSTPYCIKVYIKKFKNDRFSEENSNYYGLILFCLATQILSKIFWSHKWAVSIPKLKVQKQRQGPGEICILVQNFLFLN
jgi:hypothetical protein